MSEFDFDLVRGGEERPRASTQQGGVYKGAVYRGAVFKGDVFKGDVYKGNVYKGNVYKGDVYKGKSFKGTSKYSLSAGRAKPELFPQRPEVQTARLNARMYNTPTTPFDDSPTRCEPMLDHFRLTAALDLQVRTLWNLSTWRKDSEE